MAVEQEEQPKVEQPIRTWLLIKTEEPITEETWPHVKEVFEKIVNYPGVVRADWVSEPDDPNAPYDLIVPVDVKSDREYNEIIEAIEGLTFSPNKAEKIDTAKVKGHNPEPPPEDPLRDNEWG